MVPTLVPMSGLARARAHFLLDGAPKLAIKEIQDAIADKAPGGWEAGETTVWQRFGEADGSGLSGLRRPNVDWRVDRGGLLGRVRDQGLDCGACVAFATIATRRNHPLPHSIA